MTPPSPSKTGNGKTPDHDDIHLWLYDEENIKSLIARCPNFESNEFSALNYKRKLDDWKDDLRKHLNNICAKSGISNGDGRERKFIREGIDFVPDFDHIKIESIDRERSLYSGSYCVGICDCIISYIYPLRYKQKYHYYYDAKVESNWNAEKKMYIHTQLEKTEPKFFHDATGIREKYFVLIVEIKPKLTSASGIIGQLKAYNKYVHPKRHIGSSEDETKKSMVLVTYDKNTKYDKLFEAEGITIFRIDRDEQKQSEEEVIAK